MGRQTQSSSVVDILDRGSGISTLYCLVCYFGHSGLGLPHCPEVTDEWFGMILLGRGGPLLIS